MKFIPILLFLFACSSSRKSHTIITQTDSIASHIRDSMAHVISETVAFYESQIHNIDAGGVVFDTLYMPGDTITNTVTIMADGSIQAAGRIKSAYASRDLMQREANRWHQLYDSAAAHKDSSTVKVVHDTVTVTSVKKVTTIPWWIWLIIAGAGLFALNSKFKFI